MYAFLQVCFLNLRFSQQNSVCISPLRATWPAHLIVLCLMYMLFGEEWLQIVKFCITLCIFQPVTIPHFAKSVFNYSLS